jgi:hypothetical protein
MPRVAILSEHADVTVMIDHLLTPGHETCTLEHPLDTVTPVELVPDVVIVPLFRKPQAHARPIEDFLQDVAGGRLLADLEEAMDGHQRPVIVFGIGVTADEVPAGVKYHTFLTFPQAIQEINPLISSLIGPSPQDGRQPRSKPRA